jgi:excisionase family DNA binding protein
MAAPTRLVTVKELSDYLRVHPSTIYRLLKRGELPAIKLGSDWRFSLEAIDRWRQRQGIELEESRPHGRR